MSREVGDGDSVTEGLFEQPEVYLPPPRSVGSYQTGGGPSVAPAPVPTPHVGHTGLVRESAGTKRIGRGPPTPDPRKFRYDTTRGKAMENISFGASKVDRMSAQEAGDMLHRIHKAVGIDKEEENVLVAFDNALFLEHTLNGASLLQPGRGYLDVGGTIFQLDPIKKLLSIDQRRFFRAFADEIATVNRQILLDFDPNDYESSEKVAQLQQVALLRGLQKYPHLAHDSSDAGLNLTMEERIAVNGSKVGVLENTANNVDKPVARVREPQGDKPAHNAY